MATALCAKVVPEVGGDTVFASMSAAYEGLSERLQALIDGLRADHDIKPFKALFEDTPEDRKTLQHFEEIYPPMTHPVVRVHPATGHRVLYVNPQFTIRIKDMDERESASLLDTLFHQVLIPECQYRLHWRPYTLAMWDNRSVQHYAVHDYWPQARIMDRVTIKGTRPVGVEAADPATVQRPKKLIAAAVAHGAHKPHRSRTTSVRRLRRPADRRAEAVAFRRLRGDLTRCGRRPAAGAPRCVRARGGNAARGHERSCPREWCMSVRLASVITG